jgi:hypothetical protein
MVQRLNLSQAGEMKGPSVSKTPHHFSFLDPQQESEGCRLEPLHLRLRRLPGKTELFNNESYEAMTQGSGGWGSILQEVFFWNLSNF